jgi:hypothetical protein
VITIACVIAESRTSRRSALVMEKSRSSASEYCRRKGRGMVQRCQLKSQNATNGKLRIARGGTYVVNLEVHLSSSVRHLSDITSKEHSLLMLDAVHDSHLESLDLRVDVENLSASPDVAQSLDPAHQTKQEARTRQLGVGVKIKEKGGEEDEKDERVKLSIGV